MSPIVAAARTQHTAMSTTSQGDIVLLDSLSFDPFSQLGGLYGSLPVRRASTKNEDLISIAESILQQEPPSLANRLYKIKSRLSTAPDIALLPGGGIVAADFHEGFVRLFDANGEFESTLVRGVAPLSIAANRSGIVYFTDHLNKKNKMIQVYSMDGTFIAKWGDEYKWKPRGLAISNKGLLVIADANDTDQSVGLYTQHGKRLLQFGSKGSNKAQFNNPYYIDVDVYDRIIVSDYNNHSIKIWDDRGKFLGLLGKRGSEDGQLLYPRGVTSDTHGNIFVSDTGNQRVSLFSADGRFIEHTLTKDDALRYPYGIAFSRQNDTLAISQHSKREKGSFCKIRVYQMNTHRQR